MLKISPYGEYSYKRKIFIQNYLDNVRMEAVVMSDQKDVTTKVVTKQEVIKSLAKDFDMTIGSMSSIYNRIEERLNLLLANADEKTNIEIHLFDGVKFESKQTPQRERMDNLTGRRRIYDAKIKAKASLSRRYIEKLNRKKRIT